MAGQVPLTTVREGLWDRHSRKGHISVDLRAQRKSGSLFGGKAGGFQEAMVPQQDLDGRIEHARGAEAVGRTGQMERERTFRGGQAVEGACGQRGAGEGFSRPGLAFGPCSLSTPGIFK